MTENRRSSSFFGLNTTCPTTTPHPTTTQDPTMTPCQTTIPCNRTMCTAPHKRHPAPMSNTQRPQTTPSTHQRYLAPQATPSAHQQEPAHTSDNAQGRQPPSPPPTHGQQLVFAGPVHWTGKKTEIGLNPTAKDRTTGCGCTNSEFFRLPVATFVEKSKNRKKPV